MAFILAHSQERLSEASSERMKTNVYEHFQLPLMHACCLRLVHPKADAKIRHGCRWLI